MGRRSRSRSWRSRTLAAVLGATLALPLAVVLPSAPRADADTGGGPLVVRGVTDLAPEVRPGDQDLARDSLREDLAGERFYFVMPDRFANGDPGNDRGGLQGPEADDPMRSGFDPTHRGFYHGGDLAGLRSKLDYLQNMGVTAIWMTPMFRNRWVQGSGDDVSAGYHGYWTVDYTQLDPHFGTAEEMRALIDDAHRRGIKVFFDIVANHTADVIDYAEGSHEYRTIGAHPYLDADGRPIDLAALAGREEFPRLDPQRSFPYQPVFRDEADRTVKKPDWLNDPTLYHNRGDSTFVGESSEHGDFFGLDDLMTEHPRVVEGMKEIFTFWIDELGIDGYRVDTVKHVNLEFWQAVAPHAVRHAREHGRPDFFVFGEVYDSNPVTTSRYTTAGRMQAVLDFPFQSAARTFVAGQGAQALADVLLADDLYIDADSNAYSLPTFLGNHDMGRLAWMLRQDRPGITEAELLDRLRLAHTLLYLWRGNPVVYYGDEQGFAGTGGDQLARQDMFATRTPEYLAEDLIGTDRRPDQDKFDQDHPLYRHLAELASFVSTDPVWRRGHQELRLARGDVLAFSRIDPQTRVEHLVVANAGTAPATVDVPAAAPGTAFRPVFPTAGDGTTDAGNGTVRVTVPPLSVQVLRSTDAVPHPETAPAPTLVAPAVGTALNTRVELRAEGVDAPMAQVTFAARVEGQEEWTILGTDDTAPHRVFADLTALPGVAADRWIELRVVAKDTAGRIGADGAELALEIGPPPVGEPGAESPEWLVVHYTRPDGDYEGWGLHVWGDVEHEPSWQDPLPFAGQTAYGRFAWVKLRPGARSVGIIVHRGDEKDVAEDRIVDPAATPQVWLRQGDRVVHASEPAATGRIGVHYQRPAGDYDGWVLRVSGGIAPDQPTEIPLTGRDDYGASVEVRLDGSGQPVDYAVVRDGTTDVTGRLDPAGSGHVWLRQGSGVTHPTRAAAERRAVIHYHRPDRNYDGWTLYNWSGSAEPSPSWPESRQPDGQDTFGVYWSVPLTEDATGLSYIIHRGDQKDPDADQRLELGVSGHEVWYVTGSARPDGSASYVLPPASSRAAGDVDLTKSKAVWVSRDRLVWEVPVVATSGYQLRYDPEGRITVQDGRLAGGSVLRLEPDPEGLPSELADRFPHLRDKPVFRLRDADVGRVPEVLRGQVVAAHHDAAGALRHATGVQIGGVLDDLYAERASKLDYGPVFDGPRPTLRLWAPTAQSVRLQLFDRRPPAPDAAPSQVLDLQRDDTTGAWSITGSPSWRDRYYRYEVTVWQPATQRVEKAVVTDPYSVALSTDSTHSQIVDLTDPRTAPPGWHRHVAHGLGDDPTEHVITELHVRDFSATDPTVPEVDRGTYRAFTHRDSAGMRHLRRLAEAGMDTVHLLPTFDIATIPERREDQQQPPCDLAALPPDSEQQQECVTRTAARDAYNWGYDPLHYDVPEGSYATPDARDGWARSRQYREMVQSLHEAGLRVVVDVVYNHTTAAGNDPKSVLDRVVPGYYHRLMPDGSVANSTCCANTAPENAMMGKLVVDSVVRWARLYKVDGFRFDLMGHHPKANILAVRAALDQLTVERDGVDGRRIRIYGEGWDFGEVAGGARFEQATQANMAGTGVGTFNDRLRDAVRGGGPFDPDPRVQGLASGLAGAPNGSPANGSPEEQAARLTNYTDLVKLGMAGNGADFVFRGTDGRMHTGREVSYNGAPAGYTATPAEAITYVDAHDNETLYDALAYKLPQSTSMADRVRMQVLALAPALLGQGQPFVLAGTEFLRSKSLDRNSYDSGDWFNRYDPTLRTSVFGSGLPPAADNQDKWPYARPLLADPALRPTTADMQSTVDRTLDLLRIRRSSQLFTLNDPVAVQQKLSFPDPGPAAGPGVIVAYLDDTVGRDVDPERRGVVVVFNPRPEEQSVHLPTGGGWRLHEVQANGHDPVVAATRIEGDTAVVPARSVAVLVR